MSTSGAATSSREELKRRVTETIDSRADELVTLSKTILENPEPGFRETRRPGWSRASSRRWVCLPE